MKCMDKGPIDKLTLIQTFAILISKLTTKKWSINLSPHEPRIDF